MTRRFLSPKMLRLVQIAVMCALGALLWQVADGQNALKLLRQANLGWLAGAVGLLTLQTAMSAHRWRITAAQLGLDLPPFEALREYYLAQIVNQSMPGGFVGDAGRAVRARHQAGLLVSGQAVLFERVSGQLGMLALLFFGLAASVVTPIGFQWPEWVQHFIIALFLLFLVAPFVVGRALRVMGPRVDPARRFIQAFKTAVLARNIRIQQVVFSIGTALCNVLAFAFCAHALGVDVPVLVTFTIVPLILFAMVIPLSIGGWGFRESAAALLFPVYGALASEGLAVSVAFGLVFLITVVPGVFVIWLRPNAPVMERSSPR